MDTLEKINLKKLSFILIIIAMLSLVAQASGVPAIDYIGGFFFLPSFVIGIGIGLYVLAKQYTQRNFSWWALLLLILSSLTLWALVVLGYIQ